VFNLIYDLNPNWIERSEEEKEKIFNNYITLEQEWKILWWFALSDCEIDWEKWQLLKCLFVAKKWNWLWYVLWKEIKKHKVVFAYSKEEEFFKKLWFNKVQWQKSKSWADLFVYKKDEYKVWIIWVSGAVWVKLQALLNSHPVFVNHLSEQTTWLSSLKWLEWKQKITSILESNELVVLAVHDEIAKEIIKIKIDSWLITRIIDCSTAHRTDTSFIYGLPELSEQKKKIRDSELVANPWCHATAVILSIKPLLEWELIENTWAIITSITWYSGGGKGMISSYSENNNQASFLYSTWIKHKHEWEIKEQTWLNDFIFQPEVVNYFNGLKTNTFLQLTEKWKNKLEEELMEIFKIYYEWQEFIEVSIIPSNWKIPMDENNGTQNCSIYIKKHLNKIQVVTVIDNMMKWAGWAVIQNMNIMLWLDENTGLEE